MLHFQNLKQCDRFCMDKAREEQTELLLFSVANGRNPSCCSLTRLFHSSPPVTVNPTADMMRKITGKPSLEGGKQFSATSAPRTNLPYSYTHASGVSRGRADNTQRSSRVDCSSQNDPGKTCSGSAPYSRRGQRRSDTSLLKADSVMPTEPYVSDQTS